MRLRVNRHRIGKDSSSFKIFPSITEICISNFDGNVTPYRQCDDVIRQCDDVICRYHVSQALDNCLRTKGVTSERQRDRLSKLGRSYRSQIKGSVSISVSIYVSLYHFLYDHSLPLCPSLSLCLPLSRAVLL
eukprot:sb/3474960/